MSLTCFYLSPPALLVGFLSSPPFSSRPAFLLLKKTFFHIHRRTDTTSLIKRSFSTKPTFTRTFLPPSHTMTRVNLDGLQSFYALNNARQIPLLGLGVYLIEPGKATEDAVLWALQVQARHLPSAAAHNYDAFRCRRTSRTGLVLLTDPSLSSKAARVLSSKTDIEMTSCRCCLILVK